jgi:hypothetical protein
MLPRDSRRLESDFLGRLLNRNYPLQRHPAPVPRFAIHAILHMLFVHGEILLVHNTAVFRLNCTERDFTGYRAPRKFESCR